MEFLAFTLGGEEYGIDIQAIQELRSYGPVTRMANAPDYMKGVVNLRGTIVPIIDMRIKLHCSEVVYDQFTVVIVLKLHSRVIGMVVDSVSDVTTLEPGQIKSAPTMGAATSGDYVIGIGTLDQRMLILVDIARLLAADDTALLGKLAA
jgi:purine-binding chemotaxis protein CheW